MKRNIRILLYYAGLSVVLLATAESLHVDHAPWFSNLTQTLPQQAMMCDMAGIGYIHANSGTQTVIDVVAYWFGSPGTNRVPVQVVGFDLIPAIPTNTLCVFMASTNDWWNATICEDAAMFSWSFVTNRPSAGVECDDMRGCSHVFMVFCDQPSFCRRRVFAVVSRSPRAIHFPN